MFFRIFGIALLGFASVAQAAAIYTWKDENGIIHFSDKPQKNAKTVELPPAKTQKSLKPLAATIDDKATLPAPFVRFLTPIHEETVRDNSGNITVEALSNRPLEAPFAYRLLLDQTPHGEIQSKNQWQLSNIDRGEHTLQLQLLKGQQVIATSPAITVYLHRAQVRRGS